ncbi:hypothetical protein CMV_002662 [Castanea mollissima]|uniref:F-box/kelch-repeat protein n=1 Tax=Castanea mollissima TaxID=60419 RepID=A0A8J4RXJ2_9ROSI|nr:hypothetical protein CMV_002662 [Castanea mollissima]
MNNDQLIPGLPKNIAHEYILRIPYNHLSKAAFVCKGWKVEIELPEFLKHRKAASYSQSIIVMVEARVNGNQDCQSAKYPPTPVYGLTVYEPKTGIWSELPPIPGLSNRLTMFCRRVLGRIWWGGHDDDKNALKSVIAYDITKDEWIPLPDMAQERDQCKVIFHRGKLHVIGGYCTELQGGFEGSVEAFDFSTWKWDQVKEDYFGANMCPKACVAGDNGKLYMYWASDVATLDKDTLKIVAQLLAELGDVTYMTTRQEKLMVIGSSNFGVSHLAYMLDFINYTWTKVESPKEYSGYVQSSSYLGI